ncbi:MAG: hypothetical protein FWC91_08755 [Defluviitaleaceae bacterium]|nr:hypothetical protein [Defluviitaleaceae bacterium]
MKKYQLKFWFEHGGGCCWSINDKAKKKYGYAIKNDTLPISNLTIESLNELEKEFSTYLNWDDPIKPSPWTTEQKNSFIKKATILCQRLQNELGKEFDVLNEVKRSIEI